METVWWGLFLLALPGSFFRIPILWPGVRFPFLSCTESPDVQVMLPASPAAGREQVNTFWSVMCVGG